MYECWLLNCDLTAANPGGALSITGFAVSNGQISVTVQLVRQSPLGYINGALNLYGADDLATDFGLIDVARLDFGDGDSTFATVSTTGSVTQTVTATFDPSLVSAKFIRAAIEFPQSEDSGEEDPGEDSGQKTEEGFRGCHSTSNVQGPKSLGASAKLAAEPSDDWKQLFETTCLWRAG